MKKNRQHNRQKKCSKEKQRSTTHIYKSKDQVTRAQLIPGVKAGAPQWYSSCSKSDTRRVNLDTITSHEWERTGKCFDKWNISVVIIVWIEIYFILREKIAYHLIIQYFVWGVGVNAHRAIRFNHNSKDIYTKWSR